MPEPAVFPLLRHTLSCDCGSIHSVPSLSTSAAQVLRRSAEVVRSLARGRVLKGSCECVYNLLQLVYPTVVKQCPLPLVVESHADVSSSFLAAVAAASSSSVLE